MKNNTEIFIHRDISWLMFNERVLEEAKDAANPLLERLRFLAIFSNNLDEFFMVRLASVKRLIDAGYNRKDDFGYYPQQLHDEIIARSTSLIAAAYHACRSIKESELNKNGINILKHKQLNAEQGKFVLKYFDSTLYPCITPVAVDISHPFPVLPSKSNTFGVCLEKGGIYYLALIPVPKSISRILRLPSEKNEFSYILIDDIIRNNLEIFFRGYKIYASFLFRVIRDSELLENEEDTSSIRKVIERELKNRPKAKVVSIHVEKQYNDKLLDMICSGIDFPKEQVRVIDGDLDLTYLFKVANQALRPEFNYKSYVPSKLVYENIFDSIKEKQFIIHFPYESFQPVIDLIQSAARDRDVLAIKMTLYRTNEDSAIIQALIDAAKSGKQVTVIVEIKARFDEERNIGWTKNLEAAGCHVIYGIPGIKVHAKMLLIVRNEEGRIRRYVHLSTGNYNEITSRVYTDLSYFTANDDFAKDISDLFNVITGYSVSSNWKRIFAAPYNLRESFYELIDNEIVFQKKYGTGFIFAKMNSLEDTAIIEKLYKASIAGVKIRLIVRGICCLVPGVEGLSSTIEVRSIVGRFLEHTRIFLFNNNTEQRLFLASSDWMKRNLEGRIELGFEVANPELKDHLKFILNTYWEDTAKTRVLRNSRTYTRLSGKINHKNAQEFLIEYYGNEVKR